MSAEDDDIVRFKKILADYVAEAKTEEDLGLNLIDSISSRYEEYSSEKRLIAQQVLAVGKSPFKNIILTLKIKCPWFFGSPTAYLLKRNFIYSLYNSGAISKSQLHILNSHLLLQVAENGQFSIHMPRKKHFIVSRVVLSILFMLMLLSIYLILILKPVSIVMIPVSFVDGSIITLYMRWFYDYSWGRLNLAKLLLAKYPWLTIVN